MIEDFEMIIWRQIFSRLGQEAMFLASKQGSYADT